jgi:hypothetical protein
MDVRREFLPLRLVGPLDREMVGSVAVFELTQLDIETLAAGKTVRQIAPKELRFVDNTGYLKLDEMELRPTKGER